MIARTFREFLADESGSYTVWFLVWFGIFLAFGGLAADVSDAQRSATLLQSTADSAALAGVLSLPDTDAAINSAVFFAQTNMEVKVSGHVVRPEGVKTGNWDFVTETFTPGGTPLNAVYVTAMRSDENKNPLATNFMRIIGMDRFNIRTEAVAVQYIPDCLKNGLFARGVVDASSNNHFVNEICIHGQDHVEAQNNNGGPNDDCVQDGVVRCWDEGVRVSMGDYDNWPKMDNFATEGNNPGLPPALTEGDMDVPMVDDLAMITKILTGGVADTQFRVSVIPDYVVSNNVVEISDVTAFEAKLADLAIDVTKLDGYDPDADNPLYLSQITINDGEPVSAPGEGFIYHVHCNKPAQDAVTIPGDVVLKNMVIISDCNFKISGALLTDVTLVALGGTFNKDGSPKVEDNNFNFSSGPVLGLADSCTAGGGVRLFSNRSIHMASTMSAFGLQMVAAGDIHIAAQAGAASGITAQAGGDIKVTSNNSYGSCPGDGDAIFTSWYHRLVR